MAAGLNQSPLEDDVQVVVEIEFVTPPNTEKVKKARANPPLLHKKKLTFDDDLSKEWQYYKGSAYGEKLKTMLIERRKMAADRVRRALRF